MEEWEYFDAIASQNYSWFGKESYLQSAYYRVDRGRTDTIPSTWLALDLLLSINSLAHLYWQVNQGSLHLSQIFPPHCSQREHELSSSKAQGIPLTLWNLGEQPVVTEMGTQVSTVFWASPCCCDSFVQVCPQTLTLKKPCKEIKQLS